jgi:hypothetical protein
MRLITIKLSDDGSVEGLQEIEDGSPISLSLPQYADDSAAKTGGLVPGDWYQDSNGVVKVVQ